MVEAASADQDKATFLGSPPSFFSVEYHFRFLPRVIVLRLEQHRLRQRRDGFGVHVQLEIPLVIFACVLLVVFGLPSALDHGSIGGWLSTVAGGGGFTALMAWSIVGEWRWRQEERHRYGYAEFMPSVFFFCVLAGGSAGLMAGGIVSNDPRMGYLWALPGVVLGYLAGTFAARWVHGLGFMKTWFIYLAMLGLVLLPLEDLIMVWIYASKTNNGVWTGQ